MRAATPAPWRVTMALALLAALTATVALILSLWGDASSFGPGEMDLLITARSMASGVYPPLWAGSVHPDAFGTWMGALSLSPLLRLGVDDVSALKTLATGHYALLAGATAGLACRIAGWRGGLAAGGALVLGAPAIASAHTRYLATTVEVASIELALLWALIEWHRRPARGWLLPLGAALGTAVVYSPHAGWIAVVALGAAAHRRGADWSRPALLLGGILVAAVPWLVWRDPLGPPGHGFTVKTLGPLELVGLLDLSDLGSLLRRAPFALLTGEESLDAGARRLLHAPLALALALAAFGAAVAAARRQVPADITLVALFVVGVAAPLVLAGDLLGYPAAYRYFVPVIAPACVLLGTAVARSPRPRLAGGLLALLVAPGLLSVGGVSNTELSRSEAAFVAGQHRLVFPQDSLHSHFLMLTPWVRDDELIGWVQGYGLHVGREFARQAPVSRIEYEDSFVGFDGGVPEIVNRHWQKQRAERWLEAADWLGPEIRQAFLVGVGLGLGEDGRLEPLDSRLLDGAGADSRFVARGIGAALGERAFHIGDRAPLRSDESRAWTAAERQAMADGHAETAGPGAAPLYRHLPGRASRTLAHPHPFTYADLGVTGRGEEPTGPR